MVHLLLYQNLIFFLLIALHSRIQSLPGERVQRVKCGLSCKFRQLISADRGSAWQPTCSPSPSLWLYKLKGHLRTHAPSLLLPPTRRRPPLPLARLNRLSADVVLLPWLRWRLISTRLSDPVRRRPCQTPLTKELHAETGALALPWCRAFIIVRCLPQQTAQRRHPTSTVFIKYNAAGFNELDQLLSFPYKSSSIHSELGELCH